VVAARALVVADTNALGPTSASPIGPTDFSVR
jgi:hypothetical protein